MFLESAHSKKQFTFAHKDRGFAIFVTSPVSSAPVSSALFLMLTSVPLFKLLETILPVVPSLLSAHLDPKRMPLSSSPRPAVKERHL
ncbi:hypothetical protein JX266_011767 [Neoarthrinium moseri]|nr:hypothetical protein JX266_011767 [Neoarthrinium moseri]